MARFIYTAKSKPKEEIKGFIEAESEQDAVNKISRKGYFPLSIKSAEDFYNRNNFLSFKRISQKEIVLFTRQLSGLISAGVNIINSLNIIYKQTSNRYFKLKLNDIISRVKDGKPFSESLSSQKTLFSDLYCSMVRTGEASGNLKDILNRLSGFLEKDDDFRNTILAALTYPFFVLGVGILTVLVLMIVVVPGLTTMFKDMGQVLPLPTRILISLSDFLRGYFLFLVGLIIAAVFLLKKIYRSPQGRLALDKFKLKISILGQIILKTEISRLTRSLSLLISGGISITSALEISAASLGNKVLVAETEKFKEQIKNGASFSYALENSKIFPEFVRQIIIIGEETGSLDKSLVLIAEEYEKEVDRSLKTFARLLEPIIILVIGLVVGFIVLSMLLPIFEINFLVQ